MHLLAGLHWQCYQRLKPMGSCGEATLHDPDAHHKLGRTCARACPEVIKNPSLLEELPTPKVLLGVWAFSVKEFL